MSSTISKEDQDKFDQLFPKYGGLPSMYMDARCRDGVSNGKDQYIGLTLEQWDFVSKIFGFSRF